MQAVILAAGKGTRMRPITLIIPKSLVIVVGKPILEHVFDALPSCIEEVVLVVGYKGKLIKEYFGNSFDRKRITYVSQPKPRGTADALLVARPFLKKDSPFLLLGGDDLYHKEDLELCVKKYPTVLAAYSKSPERFGVCIIKKNGTLGGIVEKPKNPTTNLVNTGAYVLDHDIFDIPVTESLDKEIYLAEQVGKYAEKRVVQVHTTDFWYPINNIEELKKAEELLNKS